MKKGISKGFAKGETDGATKNVRKGITEKEKKKSEAETGTWAETETGTGTGTGTGTESVMRPYVQRTYAQSEPRGIFANPLCDAGFKLIFSDEATMTDFLSVLIPELDIVGLTYLDKEQLGDTIDENHVAYDLLVETSSGELCVVEMQRVRQTHFNYRAVLYQSYLIQMQARKEKERQYEYWRARRERPHWNYSFGKVYVIGILEKGWGDTGKGLGTTMKELGVNGKEFGATGKNFGSIGKDSCNIGKIEDKTLNEENQLLERYRFKEVTSNKDLEVDANVLFLHLDRFDKSAAEADGIVERYVWALKNMTVSETMPEEFDDDERMRRLFEKALSVNLSTEYAKLSKLNETMTTENDYLNAIDCAKECGLQEGRMEGLEEGIEKGIEKGCAETARRMKDDGLPADVISKYTGLSEKQVSAL